MRSLCLFCFYSSARRGRTQFLKSKVMKTSKADLERLLWVCLPAVLNLSCFGRSNEPTEGGRNGFLTALIWKQAAVVGPVCVGAVLPPSPRSSRGPSRQKITVECGERLQTAPLQASPVTSDPPPPRHPRHLTAASMSPGFGFSSFTCGLSNPSAPDRYARPPRDKPQNITGLTARTMVGRALGDLCWDERAITQVWWGR